MTAIRAADPADVPALLPLVAAYWRFEGIPGCDPGRVAPALARLLGEPRLGRGWIALADGAAVGYLLAVFVFSLEHAGMTAEIDELFVAPGRRGEGIGADLLRTALPALAAAGCRNLSLQLARGNDRARAFYHRQGFTPRSRYDILERALP